MRYLKCGKLLMHIFELAVPKHPEISLIPNEIFQLEIVEDHIILNLISWNL